MALRRPFLAALVLTAAASLGGPAPAMPAGRAGSAATALDSFDATAGADGVRVEVVTPDLPLVSKPFDGGAPVAQAHVSSLGESQAYASLPYPGDALTNAPATVFPLVGLTAPPPYPLQAASRYPIAPEVEAGTDQLSMSAKSDELGSSAEGSAGVAQSGNGIGHVSASASVVADPEAVSVTAAAESTTEASNLSGVLRIGRVHATAKVVRGGDAGDDVESSLEVEGVSVAGLTIGVTPTGITLPGTNVAVPDTSGLDPTLDQAGLSIRYLDSVRSDDGIVSAGLVVAMRSTHNVVTVTYGRVRAFASATTKAVPPAAEPVAPGDAPTAPAAPTASAAPTRTDVGSRPGTAIAPAATEPAPAPSTADTPAEVAQRPVAIGADATLFYPILVLGAVGALVGARLIRHFGVKLAWMYDSS